MWELDLQVDGSQALHCLLVTVGMGCSETGQEPGQMQEFQEALRALDWEIQELVLVSTMLGGGYRSELPEPGHSAAAAYYDQQMACTALQC